MTCSCPRRLVNCVEGYLDDVVDCFEDFVKKSMIFISVALCAVVAMIAYLMKAVNDNRRSVDYNADGIRSTSPVSNLEESPQSSKERLEERRAKSSSKNKGTSKQFRRAQSVQAQWQSKEFENLKSSDLAAPIVPSTEERVLKSTGYTNTCCKCGHEISTNPSKNSLAPNLSSSKQSLKKSSNCNVCSACKKESQKTKSCCDLCCEK